MCGSTCLYGQQDQTLHSLLLSILPLRPEKRSAPIAVSLHESCSKEELLLQHIIAGLVNQLSFRISLVGNACTHAHILCSVIVEVHVVHRFHSNHKIFAHRNVALTNTGTFLYIMNIYVHASKILFFKWCPPHAHVSMLSFVLSIYVMHAESIKRV